jgi:NADH-quinone oxidoreductase subunit L
VLTAVTALFLVGAAGKSAQIPLHVWLPDAMAGPTPVSALIHAATMVTSGIYLIVRSNVLYEIVRESGVQILGIVSSPDLVAYTGAATALVAGLIAFTQFDIKKVLAYSTVSQLGFMVAAAGMGAYVAAMFHLVTHAFFKALLFLGSGSVIHGMEHGHHQHAHAHDHDHAHPEPSPPTEGEKHELGVVPVPFDPQDMRTMGGLRHRMRTTYVVYMIGALALAGIPPLAGFWSKDEVLGALFARGGMFSVLWIVGLVAALMTAFYMTRQWVLVFWGEPRWEEGAHPHESPRSMTVPLIVLAVLSLGAGFLNTPFRFTLEHFLEPAFEGVSLQHAPEGWGMFAVLAGLSVLAGVAGVAAAWLTYNRPPVAWQRFEAGFGKLWTAWENAYWVDDLYGVAFVAPGEQLAEAAAFAVDAKGIDGTVNGVGEVVRRLGGALRGLQTGYVRNYGAGFTAGILAIIIWLTWRM